MIVYTREQLVALANRQFGCCEAEMKKASLALGFGDDWRKALHMTMLSPQQQLTSPFFLGGDHILVSYPTNTMGSSFPPNLSPRLNKSRRICDRRVDGCGRGPGVRGPPPGGPCGGCWSGRAVGCCACCRTSSRRTIDSAPRTMRGALSRFGPRLLALVAHLTVGARTPRRTIAQVLGEGLGRVFAGMLCTDRSSASIEYRHATARSRWAHRRRDLPGLAMSSRRLAATVAGSPRVSPADRGSTAWTVTARRRGRTPRSS